MTKKSLHAIFLGSIVIFSSYAATFGQITASAIKPSIIAGDVVSISSSAISINSKTGTVEVALTDKTKYLRVAAETMDFTKAVAGKFDEIAVEDKVTVSSLLGTDGKTLNARTVYFVTKADMAAKAAKEAEDWRRRGIAGRVVTVDPVTKQIGVELRTMTGSSTLSLTPKDKARFLRYAQDSVRYDEAKLSSVDEVKAGDMIRALGDRGADGTSFTAEQIITGAFQTIAGPIKSIDIEKNAIVIKNLQSNKDVTIIVDKSSVMKRFPVEVAERLAGMQGRGGVRPAGAGQTGGAQPVRPAGAPQGQSGPGGRGAGGIDDMLERFPDTNTSELKVGDMIAISSSKSSTDRVKAIKLLAGVEPFLRAAQSSGGTRRGQAVDGSFTIPGLDGIDF